MSGMPKDIFKFLYKAEEGSFWFKSRNKIIIWLLKKYKSQFKTLMEVGCGTGFVLSGVITEFKEDDKKYYGSDLYEEGLKFAKERLAGCADFFTVNLEHEGLPDKYDVIGAFDVLEHIEEDEVALKHLTCALNKDGVLVISVPQHQKLWSSTDEFAHHCRRYERDELVKKVKLCGLDIVYVNSFVSLLYPAMLFSRTNKKSQNEKKKNSETELELELNWFLNSIFSLIMKVELLLLKLGVNFNKGGSLIVVAKKQQQDL